ncbi:hypothetical protein Trydic_g19957 [Trypoxylus dichotomus]
MIENKIIPAGRGFAHRIGYKPHNLFSYSGWTDSSFFRLTKTSISSLIHLEKTVQYYHLLRLNQLALSSPQVRRDFPLLDARSGRKTTWETAVCPGFVDCEPKNRAGPGSGRRMGKLRVGHEIRFKKTRIEIVICNCLAFHNANSANKYDPIRVSLLIMRPQFLQAAYGNAFFRCHFLALEYFNIIYRQN